MNRIIFIWLMLSIGAYSSELRKFFKIDRIVFTYMDHQYWNIQADVKKLDRKTNFLNVTLDVMRDITNLKGHVVLYKFVDNVYKETALRYSGDLCKLLETFDKKYNIQQNTVLEHFITKCPIKKGHYYVRNVNGSEFGVPLIPTWKVRGDFLEESDNKIITRASVFVTIVEEGI